MEEKKKEGYVLIGIEQMEELLKTQFMMSQTVLLFEYLCSQSKYPLFLSAKSACDVLGLNPETLEQCRRKRTIRARVVGRQFLYNAYDLIVLSCKLKQRRIRYMLSKISHVVEY